MQPISSYTVQLSDVFVCFGFFVLQQECFDEKEADTCQLFEERQRYCAEEMEGLKQRCSTKLRQVSQITAKTQQALQLQVSQLQVSPPHFLMKIKTVI